MNNPLNSLYTQLIQFRHADLPNRLWIYGGILAIIIFLIVLSHEEKSKPKLPKLHISNFQLSPAEVSFFLLGIQKPAEALTATLLDLWRRNYIQLETDGFKFEGSKGPLLDHEIYILNWIQNMGNGTFTSYGQIKKFRREDSHCFFNLYQTWFEKLQAEIYSRELQYKKRDNRGHFTAYISIGLVLVFIGFIGLKSEYLEAFLIIIAGVLFTGLAIKNYGALPPKGQAVYQWFLPMENKKGAELLNIYRETDYDNLFLYMLALGRSKEDLKILKDKTDLFNYVYEQKPEFTTQIKDTFIGGINFEMQ